jgi:large subunit ribosomal protein L24
MQKKLNIKVGDAVRVMSGESKDQEGDVIAIDRTKMRVTVKGVNMIKKHNKPSAGNPQGGTIHISNLMVVVNGEASRIGRKLNENGKLVRYAKKSGEVIK